ncbi:MAG: toll/interleukin-1 receptor domain-containing protein [Lachnospiraceae bacterium]|nr:toll/interleukin-1 receptor domain-containing protein [Lachnospiraceae bacterium]
MVFKCKMCGGEMTVIEGSPVCECDYCGSKQTVPNLNDEKKIRLFERANRLRFECEFDKAQGIYENIISDFSDEAEAYWGLLLCKYGIEYVDDPKTGNKIPTCHRLSFDSVMLDPNLENALINCDKEARDLYSQEADKIEEIRRNIITISQTEMPYDVFICYKETDEYGQRTEDSVLAQQIYEALVVKDYRVFFSKISLEDKIGKEYEPYIFAALNSAKVMIVIGTEYKYFDAVWVRNEWSRYLDIIKRDKSKVIIPCYKNIDPYDLPKEFSGLQAQDLGKVGAIQDIVRGLTKLIPKGNVSAPTGITEDKLIATLKQQEKKRNIRTAIIVSIVALACLLGIFAGVNSLIEMIKNNKSTTVINNETIVKEKGETVETVRTVEAKPEKKKEWKISKIVCNTSEDDEVTDMDEITGTTTVYFHWKVEDGPTDSKIKFEVEGMDGDYAFEHVFDDENEVGDTVWYNRYSFDMDTKELRTMDSKVITIKVKDLNTNKILGGKTVHIWDH